MTKTSKDSATGAFTIIAKDKRMILYEQMEILLDLLQINSSPLPIQHLMAVTGLSRCLVQDRLDRLVRNGVVLQAARKHFKSRLPEFVYWPTTRKKYGR